MALQIYAAMSSDSDVSIITLTVSLLFSLASVSFTVIRYMSKLTQFANNGQQDTAGAQICSSKNVSALKDVSKIKTPAIILGFTTSDFLIRSVPVCSERKCLVHRAS